MTNYELACIFRPDVDPGTVKSKVEGWMAEMSATVAGIDEWGLRRLAYPIRKSKDGYYVFVRFSAEPAKVPPMKRQLNLEPTLLRFMFLKEEAFKPPKISAKKRRPAPEAAAARPERPSPRPRSRPESAEER